MSENQSDLDIDYQADRASFTFASSMDTIDEVIIEAIDYLYARMDHVKEHAFAINLVLREGLTNAVRHGNDNDPGKMVRLMLDVSQSELLKVSIEDEGQGFDWKSLSTENLPEDQDYGRGIIIMDSYFTRYSYNDAGNTLYLEKAMDA